ncbi:MAG: 3D domain-containing protein, partial [Planctomycetes bacterium]|nr:3D domain-containing protein [Planctomycetota bacterium]
YREMWATVTAYCPCSRCCGAGARGRTSLGGSAWLPGIAADPRALPYGTTVYVPGYGEQTVDDTGGAMRNSWRNHGRLHLDIRMKTHHEARQWGRRTMKVRVYGK